MNANQENKNSNGHAKVKQVMAIVALVLIAVFIITACVCMMLGNKSLMMASLFCLVAVPIMIYCLIWVYDMVHKNDGEKYESEESVDDNEQ